MDLGANIQRPANTRNIAMLAVRHVSACFCKHFNSIYSVFAVLGYSKSCRMGITIGRGLSVKQLHTESLAGYLEGSMLCVFAKRDGSGLERWRASGLSQFAEWTSIIIYFVSVFLIFAGNYGRYFVLDDNSSLKYWSNKATAAVQAWHETASPPQHLIRNLWGISFSVQQ